MLWPITKPPLALSLILWALKMRVTDFDRFLSVSSSDEIQIL